MNRNLKKGIKQERGRKGVREGGERERERERGKKRGRVREEEKEGAFTKQLFCFLKYSMDSWVSVCCKRSNTLFNLSAGVGAVTPPKISFNTCNITNLILIQRT